MLSNSVRVALKLGANQLTRHAVKLLQRNNLERRLRVERSQNPRLGPVLQ
jgi:hypothetical protein